MLISKPHAKHVLIRAVVVIYYCTKIQESIAATLRPTVKFQVAVYKQSQPRAREFVKPTAKTQKINSVYFAQK